MRACLRLTFLAAVVSVGLVCTARAAGDSVTYTYDSNGRLSTVTYANGTTITYVYDAAGNRTTVTTSCSSGGC